MLALLYAANDASPTPSPATACATADVAVTSLTSQLFKRRSGVDHYVITTVVTNIGKLSQTPDITQRVELLRDGAVLAPQSLPALGPGIAYTLAFAVDRPASERSKPLTVTLRYVLLAGDRDRNACDPNNDEITKTF
jgi:hypothetical protein